VALSEHEQSQLDEIERGLFPPDQTITTRPRSAARARLSLRRPILAIGGITAGMTLVLVGLVGNVVAVSVLGFIVIVGAAATARINLDGIRDRFSASVSAQTRKLADGDRRSEKRQPPRSMDDA
jgi:hypothetical protein